MFLILSSDRLAEVTGQLDNFKSLSDDIKAELIYTYSLTAWRLLMGITGLRFSSQHYPTHEKQT